MSESEINDARTLGCRVLQLRHLEAYLLADDVLRQLAEDHGSPELGESLIAARDVAVEAAVGRGKQRDDLKAAAGPFVVELKRLLNLVNVGADHRTVLIEVVSPALREGLETFKQLDDDIFGDLDT